MEAFCKVCDCHKPASFRKATDPTGKEYEDLCCDECDYIIATVTGRDSAAEKERDEAKAQAVAMTLERDMRRMAETRNAELIRERDKASNQLLEKIEALNQATAWGEKLKAKLRDAMEWNWLDDDIEQHCDVESFRRLLDEPAPSALSHLRQEIRREALEECAKACEQWRSECDSRTMQAEGWAANEIAEVIRRLAEQEKQG